MIKFFSIIFFVAAASTALIPENEGGLIPDRLAVQYNGNAKVQITKDAILSLFQQINGWTSGRSNGISDTVNMAINYSGGGIFKGKRAKEQSHITDPLSGRWDLTDFDAERNSEDKEISISLF